MYIILYGRLTMSIIAYKDYYISSGAKNKLYTLRQIVAKKVGEEVYDDTIYVRTLCADKKKAIQKAKEYIKDTGLPLCFTDFEVHNRQKPSDIDWTKFQTGKYQNHDYRSVCESDPNYVVYMISNYNKSQSYAKTLDLCKSLPKINAILEKKQKEEKARQEEIRKRQEDQKNYGHHHYDGDTLTLSLEVVGITKINNGYTHIVSLKNAEGKNFVYFEEVYPQQNYSPVSNLLGLGFFNFYAVIKHGNYNGVKQTYLRTPRKKDCILIQS